MAIAWRASAAVTGFGSSTSVVCNKPSGVVSGYEMRMAVWIYDNPAGDVTTPPSGWTLVSAGSLLIGNIVQRIYKKTAGGSEPSTYTTVINNLDVCNIVIGSWSGVDNATPDDATATGSSGTGTNRTATGLTTVTDNAVIAIFSTGYARALSGGFAGTTNRLTWDTKSVISDKLITPAGATGNIAATSAADANGWATCMMALRPASAAASLIIPPPRMPMAILAR